jgi:hypothetical protein
MVPCHVERPSNARDLGGPAGLVEADASVVAESLDRSRTSATSATARITASSPDTSQATATASTSTMPRVELAETVEPPRPPTRCTSKFPQTVRNTPLRLVWSVSCSGHLVSLLTGGLDDVLNRLHADRA